MPALSSYRRRYERFAPYADHGSIASTLHDKGEAHCHKLDDAGTWVTTISSNDVIHDFGLLNWVAEMPQTKLMFTEASATLKNI